VPGPTSGTGSLGGGLLVRKVTVGLAEAGDEALAGGKTEEDRNDAQGYRRDREPTGAKVVTRDSQQNPDGLHRNVGRGSRPHKERGNEHH
jgi:hypothetical protein